MNKNKIKLSNLNNKISLLETIFFDMLIKSVPDIWEAISTHLISDKSRKIKEVPSLQSWLKYYRNSKEIFEHALIEVLPNRWTGDRCC